MLDGEWASIYSKTGMLMMETILVSEHLYQLEPMGSRVSGKLLRSPYAHKNQLMRNCTIGGTYLGKLGSWRGFSFGRGSSRLDMGSGHR